MEKYFIVMFIEIFLKELNLIIKFNSILKNILYNDELKVAYEIFVEERLTSNILKILQKSIP